MLRALLAKDLRRAWRNPLPWLINLALPLFITAIIGATFGGRSQEDSLGRIRFAVVDEDDSRLTRLLRGGINQGEGAKHLEPVFLDRDTALRQITNSEISAVLIIPTNFTRDYIDGSNAVSLQLIKNPAESIHPTVIEELLGVVVTGLNEISRNLQSQFPGWREAMRGDPDYHEVALMVETVGGRVEALRKYINPPLVSYTKEDNNDESKEKAPEKPSPATNTASTGKIAATNPPAATPVAAAKPGAPEKTAAKAKAKPRAGIFGFLLLGMAAMFLLFLASSGMTDLQRELRFRTFERYQTFRVQLFPFVAGKVVFTVVMLAICLVVMLEGGALIFRFQWQHPLPLAALAFSYACFAAGLMAVLVAVAPDERYSATINNVASMIFGIAGGCMFPSRALPPFIANHITPLLPSSMFVEAARSLEFNDTPVPWPLVVVKMLVISLVLTLAAVALFQRRFKSGSRA